MSIRLIAGDCRDVLPTLAADSVQCCITSPPYYALRSYLDAAHPDKHREIGSESSPSEYLATMVAVFREVRRVLRPDGTCWVNMGDSYASNGASGLNVSAPSATFHGGIADPRERRSKTVPSGLKPKDLLLMPARLALALQAPQHYGPIAKETDRAWMAAFMDGEGTISIARNVAAKSRGAEEYCQVGYTPFVSAGNQDIELVERLVQITSCGKVGLKDRPSIDSRQIRSRRDYYGWRVDAKLATAIIRDIYPFLIAKRKQAVLAYNLALSNEQGRSLRGNGALPRSEQEKRELLKVLVNACNQRQPVDMPSWLIEPPSNVEQGWWVRSDIIIAKRNPMPESARDRPTSAHEHVFLLTKNSRYFFDPDAVREEQSENTNSRGTKWRDGNMPKIAEAGSGVKNNRSFQAAMADLPAGSGRNIRNVWDISTEAFGGAHFATMPTSVVERCIRAGTSERGCCAACGAPWRRVTQSAFVATQDPANLKAGDKGLAAPGWEFPRGRNDITTTGWAPGCKCNADVVPCTVLDPFAGAGTTLLVADRLQRDAIGIELSPDYTTMAMDRCRADAPLFTSFPPAEDPEEARMGDLFQDMAAD